VTRWFTKAPIDQQLIGLDLLWLELNGAAVLDVGCAEGLISQRCWDAGAALVHGVDNRSGAIEEASRAHGRLEFFVHDCETWEPPRLYDVVLMLGVLHKLADPAKALRKYLAACIEFAVVRLPTWPILIDSRSGNVPIDLEQVAGECGFKLTEKTSGPHGQWVGYLSRQ
jgi:SAM-dependent methyltransferase